MPRITLETNDVNVEADLTISKDFISCLMTALIAAMPAFLEALMTCLAGQPNTGEHKPGDRFRCTPTSRG